MSQTASLPRGRGAVSNADGRYERLRHEIADDGWESEAEDEPRKMRTQVLDDTSKSIIAKNDSPDIGFDRSINPYRGCEHGCVYCYARPSHAWLGYSPGLDFETILLAKRDAGALLRQALARPAYRPKLIAIGTNTDPYQPIERELKIMRDVLETLAEARHPVSITTKSATVLRDLDLLQELASHNAVHVTISVTSLDRKLSRTLEPRASAPHRRLDALETLAEAGVPTAVNVAPVLPGLTDHELESILAEAAARGVKAARYIALRLPLEVKDLFQEWLEAYYPDRAQKVLSLVRQMRGGKLNDPNFSTRMKGNGPYAQMIETRFRAACERLGLNRRDEEEWISARDFRRPGAVTDQLSFDL